MQETTVAGVRQRRPQARSIETKQKIFEAATREFAEHGFDGASTRSIAAAAGVNHPLVAYHYGTKAGLWRAVVSQLNRLLDERFDKRMQGLGDVDDATTLRLLLEEIILFSHDHVDFHWIMSEVARVRSERLGWLIAQSVRSRNLKIIGLIGIAQRQERFVAGDPGHLLYTFIGAVTRIYMVSTEMEMITGRSVSDPGFVAHHARVCLGLFFKDPPSGVGSPPAFT